MQDRSISSICNLMTFYENVPLRPGIMELLIAVADERHRDLKNELADNYASAASYPFRLIDYRTSSAVNFNVVAVTSPSRGDESLAARNCGALFYVSGQVHKTRDR